MPDTPRTKAALATLLADNTSGDISPQDLRDFLESMDLPYGEAYISSSASTSFPDDTTWTKISGTTTLGEASDFDMPASNRLRYTGAATRKFVVSIAFSFNDDGSGLPLFRIAKNGTTAAKSEAGVPASWGFGGETAWAGCLQCIVELATNDYVELYGKSGTGGGGSSTVLTMNMIARALFD
ncbi:MAG: hypothetical protein IT443_11900 [Phycisphaeraceae bacterium]|nr:hypothetical protein [Phycisphaeraceae bacterium]